MQKSTPVFLTAKIQVCLFFLKLFCALVVGSTVAVVHEITEPFLSKLIDTIQDCSGIVKEAGGTLTFRLWCCRRLGLWRRASQWQRGYLWVGLDAYTIQFFGAYKYGEELMVKLAKAMR